MNTDTPMIATAADDRYAVPLAVMLRSLAAHLPDGVAVRVFVLSSGLAEETHRLVNQACLGSTLDVRHINVMRSIVSDLKTSHHVSTTTYFRLLLESALPDVHKLIYLDADTIIQAPITELWDVHLDGLMLAAVRHASRLSSCFSGPRGVPSFAKLGLPGDSPVFNAGVMVIDLDKWRGGDVSKRALAYLRTYREDVLWWDQDALNVVLHNQWKELPAEWNVMTNHFSAFTNWRDSILAEHDYARAIGSPSLIHFASEDKPWLPNYSGLFLEMFRHYLQSLYQVAPEQQSDGANACI